MSARRLSAIGVASLVLALLSGLPMHGARGAPTIWTWPSSSPPCNGTLQACVDNASSGDAVLIAQNGLINEQITISDKSLTLEANPGFAPEVNSLNITTPTGASTVDVRVARLQVAHTIFVQFTHGSGHTATLDHVTAQSSGADPGIYGTIYVASTVNVLDSSVTQAGFYPGILLTSPSAPGADLRWNVTGNTVSGALAPMTQAGISLSATDAGSVRADAVNNSIWDVGQGVSSGSHGGIVLFARGPGNAEFNVVGNTMDKITGDGVNGENQVASPARFKLNLFDNIIANTSGSAVNLVNDSGTTGPFAVLGGHNDLFANSTPNHLAGTSIGTHLTVAPKFVNGGAGNLQLNAASPLIDQGLTCSPAGVAGPDAAGLDRLAGRAIDIGAYEWNAGPPGVVALGTNGPDALNGGPHPDILCGGGGKDTLVGKGGGDFLDGGTGSDHVVGGSGNDSVFGGSGKDRLLGGSGKDKLVGGSGKDRLFGNAGKDLLCGHDGKPGDYLNGGPGRDSYRADRGDTKISLKKLGSC